MTQQIRSCPFPECDRELTKAGLLGHIRHQHFGQPHAREVYDLVRTIETLAAVEDRVEKLEADSEITLSGTSEVRSGCLEGCEEARAKLDRLLANGEGEE